MSVDVPPKLLLDFMVVMKTFECGDQFFVHHSLKSGSQNNPKSPIAAYKVQLLHQLVARLNGLGAFPVEDLQRFADTRLSKSPQVDNYANEVEAYSRLNRTHEVEAALVNLLLALEPGELPRWLCYLSLPKEEQVIE